MRLFGWFLVVLNAVCIGANLVLLIPPMTYTPRWENLWVHIIVLAFGSAAILPNRRNNDV